ncbi:MAG TPA: RHS repeat-associated core domain-containing protein, partial [Polyangiaceae bacterium]|nr:RHS repeat-associated core domain-containing protein [Polyangiaceae bacterium]
AKVGGPLPAASNLLGRLSWVEYPIGARHYSYDERGSVQHRAEDLWDGISPFDVQVRTTQVRRSYYDATATEVGRDLPGGFTTRSTLNARGLVASVQAGLSDGQRTVTSGVRYDERGLVTRLDQANGLRQCRKYDERGALTHVLLATAVDANCEPQQLTQAGFGLFHLRYRWGFDALLKGTEDLSRTRAGADRLDASYGYDRLQELVSATTADGSFGYGYDAIQNLTRRTSQQGSGAPIEETLVYGEAGAGPNAVTHVGGTELGYDAAGQLKAYNGYTLKFDAAGRLKRAQKSGGKTIEYYYDAFGDRKLLISIDGTGSRRIYRYPFEDFEERNGSEAWRVDTPGGEVELRRSNGLELDAVLIDELTAYVNAPSGQPQPLPREWLDLDGDGDGFDAQDLAVAMQGFWNGTRPGGRRVEWRYEQADQIESALLVTDSTGQEVSVRRYGPYGAMVDRRGVSPSRGFAGAELEPDEDLGLTRIGARYYAPGIGRWVTPDRFIGESPERMAADPLQTNLYAYARNNPIVFTDPTGFDVTVKAKAGKLQDVKELKPGQKEPTGKDADGEYDGGELSVGAHTKTTYDKETDTTKVVITYDVSVAAGSVLYKTGADPQNVDAEDAGRTLQEHEYGHAGIALEIGASKEVIAELLDSVQATSEITLPGKPSSAELSAAMSLHSTAVTNYLIETLDYVDHAVNHKELADRYTAPNAPVYVDPESPPDNPRRASPSEAALGHATEAASRGRAKGEAFAKSKAEKAKKAANKPAKKDESKKK